MTHHTDLNVQPESLAGNNPTVAQVQAYLVQGNGWSIDEFNEFIAAHQQYTFESGATSITRDMWTFLAMGFNV